jgi:CheY-like chemotaxis protein
MSAKRILVVDDERHMQRLIQFNLEKLDCTVQTAGSGTAALESLRSQPVDLLLVDLVMEEMDGFSIVRAVRELPHGKHLPVIMLTSRGQADTRQMAAELGIAAFLTKPFSPIELVNQARKLLAL